MSSDRLNLVNTVADKLADSQKGISKLPQLKGSPKQIEAAVKVHREFAKSLTKYALTRDSSGRPVDVNFASQLITGSKEDRANCIISVSEQKTYDNSDLLMAKIESEISLANDLSARYSRAKEIILNDSAAFWLNCIDYLFIDYIDGKSNQYS